MKTRITSNIIVLVAILISCNRPAQVEVSSIQKENKADYKNIITSSDTTINVNCVKLTIKVIDNNEKIVPNCIADLKMYGATVGKEYIYTWKLSNFGDTTVYIHSQDASAHLQVSNNSGTCIVNHFPKGITQDTKIIYCIKKCGNN
jgi:hypothetical protein